MFRRIVSTILALVLVLSVSMQGFAKESPMTKINGYAVTKETKSKLDLPIEETELVSTEKLKRTHLDIYSLTFSDDVLNISGNVRINNVNIPLELNGEVSGWEDNAIFANLTDKTGNWLVQNFAIYYNVDEAILFDSDLIKKATENVLTLWLKNVKSGEYAVFETINFEYAPDIEDFSKEADFSQIMWIAKYAAEAGLTENLILDDNEQISKNSLRAATHIEDGINKTYVITYTMNGYNYEEWGTVRCVNYVPVNYTNYFGSDIVKINSKTLRNNVTYLMESGSIEVRDMKMESQLRNSNHRFYSGYYSGSTSVSGSGNSSISIGIGTSLGPVSFGYSYTSWSNATYGSGTLSFPNNCGSTLVTYPSNRYLQLDNSRIYAQYFILDTNPATSTGCKFATRYTFTVTNAFSNTVLDRNFIRDISTSYSES